MSNKQEEERKIRVDALKRQVVDRSCKDGSRMSHIEHHRWQLDGLKKPSDKWQNWPFKKAPTKPRGKKESGRTQIGPFYVEICIRGH